MRQARGEMWEKPSGGDEVRVRWRGWLEGDDAICFREDSILEWTAGDASVPDVFNTVSCPRRTLRWDGRHGLWSRGVATRDGPSEAEDLKSPPSALLSFSRPVDCMNVACVCTGGRRSNEQERER